MSDKTTAAVAAAAPKLYTNKPKKGQLKQAMASTSAPPSSTIPPPPPPPPPPKLSFARRYKFLWPLLLTVNLAVGAYIFTRTKKKGVVEEEEEPTTPGAATVVAASVSENSVLSTSVIEPVKLREPIPEDQQRELFKWLLEEKRKVKAKDPEEKKRIDEEKALLKHFIRAKSIPSL